MELEFCRNIEDNEKIIKNEIERILQKQFSTKPENIEIVFMKGRGPEYLRDFIILQVEEGRYCQFIYQYSHEYTHHIFDNLYRSKGFHFDWFEEVICEAVSLWAFDHFSKRPDFWESLSQSSAPYVEEVKNYLKNEISRYNKDDSHIPEAYRYYHDRTVDIKRPLLKISADLFHKLSNDENAWRTIKRYNAIIYPQPPERPEWLK